MPSTRPRRPLRSRLTSPMYCLGDADLDGHDRLEQDGLGLQDAVLERHRGRDLERQLVRVDRVERAVVERRLEVGQRDSRRARPRRPSRGCPSRRPRRSPSGTEPPTTFSANSTPPPGFGSSSIQTSPNMPWPPVCFLYRPWTLVLPRIVSRYGTARRVGHDRGAELALEPLDDDRDVGLAHRAQDLLAGRRERSSARRRLLLEHPLAAPGPSCRGRPWTRARSRPTSVGSGKSSGGSVQRPLAGRERVAGLGHRRASRPRRSRRPCSSPIGSCSLPWSSSSWPIRSSSPRVAFQTCALRVSVPDSTRR